MDSVRRPGACPGSTQIPFVANLRPMSSFWGCVRPWKAAGTLGKQHQVWASANQALSPIQLLADYVTLGQCSASLALVPHSVSSKPVCELQELTV